MGLLDSVLGQVLGGGAQNPAQPSGGGGLGGLGALVAGLGGGGGMAGMAGVLASLVGNDGALGGIGGLLAKFKQAGMGEQADSWVGNGENKPVSPDQVNQALGSNLIGGLASKLGLDAGALLPMLSAALPMVVNHFTPKGEVPPEGVGNQDDVLASLGDMLRKA